MVKPSANAKEKKVYYKDVIQPMGCYLQAAYSSGVYKQLEKEGAKMWQWGVWICLMTGFAEGKSTSAHLFKSNKIRITYGIKKRIKILFFLLEKS